MSASDGRPSVDGMMNHPALMFDLAKAGSDDLRRAAARHRNTAEPVTERRRSQHHGTLGVPARGWRRPALPAP